MEGLNKILGDRYFVIPHNQRGFSWTTEQLKAILADLEFASAQKKHHYCGALITRSDPTAEPVLATNYELSHKYFLDDGQQRLTTFFLILLALRNRLKSFDDSRHVTDIAEVDDLLFYHTQSSQSLRLMHEQRPLEQALNHVFVDGPEPRHQTSPVRALLAAWDYLQKRVERLDANQCLEWKNRVTRQAQFVLVDLQKQNLDPYLTFDAINSRGLPLGQFDKIKNFALLLARTRNLDIDPADEWYRSLEALEIRSLGSRSAEQDFVTEMYSVFHNRRVAQDSVHSDFVDTYAPLLDGPNPDIEEKLVCFVHFWKRYATAFADIAARDSTRRASGLFSRSTLQYLTRLDNLGLPTISRPIVVAMWLHRNDANLARIAHACEVFTFRVFGAVGYRKDKGSREILSLAHLIARNEASVEDAFNTICAWLTTQARLEDVVRVVGNGQPKYNYDRRVKGWEYTYYFLYEYELSKLPRGVEPIAWETEREARVNTIEHILPQGHRDGAWWQEHWPNEDEANGFVHRLGNLVLTGGNSTLGRKPMPLKTNDQNAAYSYLHANATSSEKELVRFSDHGERWDTASIRSREVDMLRFAVTRWNLDCIGDLGRITLPDEHRVGDTSISVSVTVEQPGWGPESSSEANGLLDDTTNSDGNGEDEDQ